MKRNGHHILLILILSFFGRGFVQAQPQSQKLVLNHTDELEVVYQGGHYITYVNGHVDFRTESGHIYCDSAVFLKGVFANLRGNVFVDDQAYLLKADSVYYKIPSEEATALGKHVELWSYADSLYGVGVQAFYNRKTGSFSMEHRPTIYLGYPDTAKMVEVIADYVDYKAERHRAEAIGNVLINSQDLAAKSGCAVMNTEKNVLDLYTKPVAKRGLSTISGEFISVYFANKQLDRIDVMDSAYGEFIEPIDSAKTDFDRSKLRGRRMIMNFLGGELHEVLCYGQAYSWYYPSMRGTREYHENTVSGDTIRFAVKKEQLRSVTVVGGAEGTYVTGKMGSPPASEKSDTLQVDTTRHDTINAASDSLATLQGSRLDTINYRSHYIEYNLADSMITLQKRCEVESGTMSLGAYKVELNTATRDVEAFSAEVNPDSADMDYYNLAQRLQPATIPVLLKDGNQQLYGDYLQYSIDTQKGRIVQTKSAFEKGYYYGTKLLREKKDVYYIEDGYFTTCNAAEPHYHFFSTHMKLMENNKLIAKPVIFYLGRIPLLAIPYYVFPLKKGRHSGLLPFTFGRFERGQRYVNNVGYFWAPSDYWDWTGAFDYHEQERTIFIKNRVEFVKRYVLNGYANVEYKRATQYNSTVAQETSPSSWNLQGAYNQKISPSFEIRSQGTYQSTSNFYNLSNNIGEILNRQLTSQLNFSKKFGSNTSLTGSVYHTENLDNGTRSDNLPTLALSLPTIYPFGSGSRNAEGQLVQHWWNNFTLRYNPGLVNYSSSKSAFSTVGADTTYVTTDTIAGTVDTIITPIVDTVKYGSHKKYAVINHNPTINLPAIRLGNYVQATPSFSYRETWYKIFETDQSRAAGIDASKAYRTYGYGAGITARTTLYGTIYPNMFGVIGLRHVLEPSVGYAWSPEINRHPDVRAFAGGGAASSKSSRLVFGLGNDFWAKLGQKGNERNVELLSLRSSFSYDFEQNFHPLSLLSTSFSTSTLPGINLSGSMTHSFYDPRDATSDKPRLFNPWLLSFNVNANFTITGQTFLFTDPAGIPQGADSAQQLSEPNALVHGGSHRGWNLSVAYSFSESGRYVGSYSKRQFARFNLSFSLTPVTSVTYSQDYNFVEGKALYSSVNITRTLHCWTGSIYWVPIGPNRGFGFKLFVTDLDAIKIDSGYDSFLGSNLLNQANY